MPFKTVKFISRIKEVLNNKINEIQADKVIWIGDHMGFPIIYRMLLDMGIKDVKIMDNDTEKVGIVYYPYGEKYGMDFGVVIKKFGMDCNHSDTRCLYVFSNTHGDELLEQLRDAGVGENYFIDLYSMQTGWMNEIEQNILRTYEEISLRKLQLLEFDILKAYRDYCKSGGLTYFLAEGSLIGAIRHKGFIPWDDDIDVFMPYEDYVRFVENFPENRRLQVLDYRKTPDYPIQFAKLMDTETYLIHPCLFGYFTMGICIDVFPIAGYPDDENEIENKWKRNRELDVMRSLFQCADGIEGLEQNNLYELRENISKEKYQYSFYTSNKVGTMQQIKFDPWVVDKRAFEETIEVEFEGDYFSCPKGYDEYLTIRYGDYMKLPPLEDRKMHTYPTFIKKL